MRQLRCNDSTQAEWDAVLQKMCERPGNLVSTRTAPHALQQLTVPVLAGLRAAADGA
jgi:hypothetical protein